MNKTDKVSLDATVAVLAGSLEVRSNVAGRAQLGKLVFKVFTEAH